MPVEIAPISPAPNGTIANGDLYDNALAVGALNPQVTNFQVGVVPVPKQPDAYKTLFLRFEIQVPQGSVINALRLNLWGNANVNGTMTRMKGGFIRPQSIDGGFNWQHADGVAHWRDGRDVPWAEKQNFTGPFFIFDEVWWDGAAAFENQAMTTQPTTQTTWSIGDGISGFNNVTGLVTQLQSYLDDENNELLRGTGNDVGGLPVCIQLLHSEVAPASGGFQGGISSDFVSEPEFAPTLEIDWTALFADQGVTYTVIAKPAQINVTTGVAQVGVTAKSGRISVTAKPFQASVTAKADAIDVVEKPDTIDVTGA